MEQYFKDVVSELSIEDMQVLGHLYDQDATENFKAVRHIDIIEKCSLTEATFRKVLYRLVAKKFIDVVIMKRQHSTYITQYGIAALKRLLRIEEVSA